MHRTTFTGITPDFRSLVVEAVGADGQPVELYTALSAETLAVILDAVVASGDERTEVLRRFADFELGLEFAETPSFPVDGPTVAGALAGVSLDGNLRPPKRAAPTIKPQEVQRRLRAGETPSELAEATGVDQRWIERWAPTVEAEKNAVLTQMMGQYLFRPGFPRSTLRISHAVTAGLEALDVDPDRDTTWTVTRRQDEKFWTITLKFYQGRSISRAVWRLSVKNGRVAAQDDIAVGLSWAGPVVDDLDGSDNDLLNNVEKRHPPADDPMRERPSFPQDPKQ